MSSSPAQNDILASDDLTSDMDLKYRPPPADEPNPVSAHQKRALGWSGPVKKEKKKVLRSYSSLPLELWSVQITTRKQPHPFCPWI